MSEESKSTSVLLTEELLGEASSKGLAMTDEAKAGIEALRAEGAATEEIVEEPVDEAVESVDTRSPGEQVTDEAREAVEEKVVDLPSFQFVPDDELAAFEEEEAERTLAEVEERLEAVDEEDMEETEDLDELRRQLHQAQKALAYQKNLRAKQERGNWEAEAAKKYPLANVTGIQAKTRNAFMREAAQSHNAVLTHVKPHLDELESLKKAVVAQAKAEGREEAKQAWGKPSTGPGTTAVDQGAFNSELESARKSGNLQKVLAVYRKHSKGV